MDIIVWVDNDRMISWKARKVGDSKVVVGLRGLWWNSGCGEDGIEGCGNWDLCVGGLLCKSVFVVIGRRYCGKFLWSSCYCF